MWGWIIVATVLLMGVQESSGQRCDAFDASGCFRGIAMCNETCFKGGQAPGAVGQAASGGIGGGAVEGGGGGVGIPDNITPSPTQGNPYVAASLADTTTTTTTPPPPGTTPPPPAGPNNVCPIECCACAADLIPGFTRRNNNANNQ